MDKYENVNVDKLANIYFKGNVISRNIFSNPVSKIIELKYIQIKMIIKVPIDP